MLSKKRIALLVALTLSGLCFLVFGGIFKIIFDKILHEKLKEKLSLEDGTVSYKMWLKPPVPVSFQIFVFDVKNPLEVSQGKAVPAVEQKGPYVYKMLLEKTDVVRHDNNNTISYIQPQGYVFDEEASVGPMSDTFTALNIPLITIAEQLRNMPSFVKIPTDILLQFENETAFKTLSIDDIFWGYEDPILHKAYDLLAKFHIHLPFLQSKFGFFAGKNNSNDGHYNVFSGVDGNLDKYCLIDRWNGQRRLNVWGTNESNRIGGSDGSMHPPFVTEHSNLEIFDAYLQRTLKLKYTGDSSYKGLDTLRFVVPFSEFANASVNPDNAGFCTPSIKHCIPSGSINLTTVSFGAPMYSSLPHFVGGDPYYHQQVMGMQPDPAKHQPYYTIHALTGVTIQAARKYQINIRTQSHKYITALKKFPTAYFPIAWFNGVSVMDDDDVSEFRDKLQHMVNSIPYIRGGMFGAGVFFLLLACCLFGYWHYKGKKVPKDDKSELISNQEEKHKKRLNSVQ